MQGDEHQRVVLKWRNIWEIPKGLTRSSAELLGLVAERLIERCRWWVPEERADKIHRFSSAVETIHTGVFPLYRDWSIVPDKSERPETVFPWHITVPSGHEVPTTSWIAPR